MYRSYPRDRRGASTKAASHPQLGQMALAEPECIRDLATSEAHQDASVRVSHATGLSEGRVSAFGVGDGPRVARRWADLCAAPTATAPESRCPPGNRAAPEHSRNV